MPTLTTWLLPLLFALPSIQSPTEDDLLPRDAFKNAIQVKRATTTTPVFTSASRPAECATPTVDQPGYIRIPSGRVRRSVTDEVYVNPLGPCNSRGKAGGAMTSPCGTLGWQDGGDVIECQEKCNELGDGNGDGDENAACKAYQFGDDGRCTLYTVTIGQWPMVSSDDPTGYFSDGGNGTETDCYSPTTVSGWKGPTTIP